MWRGNTPRSTLRVFQSKKTSLYNVKTNYNLLSKSHYTNIFISKPTFISTLPKLKSNHLTSRSLSLKQISTPLYVRPFGILYGHLLTCLPSQFTKFSPIYYHIIDKKRYTKDKRWIIIDEQKPIMIENDSWTQYLKRLFAKLLALALAIFPVSTLIRCILIPPVDLSGPAIPSLIASGICSVLSVLVYSFLWTYDKADEFIRWRKEYIVSNLEQNGKWPLTNLLEWLELDIFAIATPLELRKLLYLEMEKQNSAITLLDRYHYSTEPETKTILKFFLERGVVSKEEYDELESRLVKYAEQIEGFVKSEADLKEEVRNEILKDKREKESVINIQFAEKEALVVAEIERVEREHQDKVVELEWEKEMELKKSADSAAIWDKINRKYDSQKKFVDDQFEEKKREFAGELNLLRVTKELSLKRVGGVSWLNAVKQKKVDLNYDTRSKEVTENFKEKRKAMDADLKQYVNEEMKKNDEIIQDYIAPEEHKPQ